MHIMGRDPRQIMDDSPMSGAQIAAVAVTIGLNALDGFDVLSISFASPGITKEWGIDRAALGLVLSMELIGMAVGSIFLGGIADIIGRRKTILACLVVMATGMFMSSKATGIADLSIWRVITGLGIGGMLAAINAVAAEFSNKKNRNMAVALMAIGYPVGAVLGGMVASHLMKTDHWTSVFMFGAIATAACIPLVLFMLPESVAWLCQKKPAGALEQVNRTLARYGHEPVDALPVIAADAPKQSVMDLFKPGMIGTVVLVTFAYFMHVTTFYFMLKWVPQIVADMGFSPSLAGGVLVWTNVGGAIGGATFGILTKRFPVRRLLIVAMILSSVMVVIFGRGYPDLTQLSIICAIAGLFTSGAIVGLYALFAEVYPTHIRASGTGFAIGFGRGGAAMAPALGGLLFAAGYGLQMVAMVMACGSLVAAAALVIYGLRRNPVAAAL
jgi:benzoate transport